MIILVISIVLESFSSDIQEITFVKLEVKWNKMEQKTKDIKLKQHELLQVS